MMARRRFHRGVFVAAGVYNLSLTASYGTAGTATSAPFSFNEQGTYTVWGRILASDGA